jgi:hypothetical protein
LPAPEDEDVLHLTTLVSQKIQPLLERRGFGTEADSQQADPLSHDDPGMAALLANSVRRRIAVGSNAGRGVVRLGDQIDGDSLDAFRAGTAACPRLQSDVVRLILCRVKVGLEHANSRGY